MSRMLSEHFSLEEMTRSHTAMKHGIENEPDGMATTSLAILCLHVLEPLRQWYGKPIRVSSGYRCPELNRLVGGVKDSQHMKGEAADLFVPSVAIARQWFRYIRDHLEYDQLILERNANGYVWIHVSCRSDSSKNRHQCIC